MMGCGKKKEPPSDVLLRYEDKEITLTDVVNLIPGDLLPEDSAALFNNIIEGWIRDVLLSEFAEERLYDTNKIDRLVNDYRNSLIVQEYLTRMKESQVSTPDEQKVKEYYDRHKKDLKLELPLVKGVFLKINSDTQHKERIKGLLTSDDPDKIDKLEQDWIDKAVEYNYFRDKWIDWEMVKGMIPYRFGDAESFLKENKYFETDYGDFSYYLQITEWLPAGEEQPYEFAKSWITTLLTQGELAEYERILVNKLVEKSIKDSKLETIGYNPIKHELK